MTLQSDQADHDENWHGWVASRAVTRASRATTRFCKVVTVDDEPSSVTHLRAVPIAHGSVDGIRCRIVIKSDVKITQM